MANIAKRPDGRWRAHATATHGVLNTPGTSRAAPDA